MCTLSEQYAVPLEFPAKIANAKRRVPSSLVQAIMAISSTFTNRDAHRKINTEPGGETTVFQSDQKDKWTLMWLGKQIEEISSVAV